MDERDERLGTVEGASVRPRGPKTNARGSVIDGREAAERETQERDFDDRELSDDERLEMFRASMYQSVLPDLPYRPGYHSIWLTTTNARDSISQRMRMGYKLARLEDIPSWDGVTTKAGDVGGVVAVNEMVGAYLPLRLYHLYMKEAHHDAPLRDEEKLRANVDLIKEQAAMMGSTVELGDAREGPHGMNDWPKRAGRAPEFTGG